MDYVGTWYAAEDHLPGKTPMLRVTGTVRFLEGGWTAELRDHDGPQGINERVKMLDLVVTEPEEPIGTPATNDVDVAYEHEVLAGDRCEYDHVHVRVVGAEAPDKFLDVDCLELPTDEPST